MVFSGSGVFESSRLGQAASSWNESPPLRVSDTRRLSFSRSPSGTTHLANVTCSLWIRFAVTFAPVSSSSKMHVKTPASETSVMLSSKSCAPKRSLKMNTALPR